MFVQEMERRLYRCLFQYSAMLDYRPHCLAYHATCLIQQDIRLKADNGKLVADASAEGRENGVILGGCCVVGKKLLALRWRAWSSLAQATLVDGERLYMSFTSVRNFSVVVKRIK